MFYRVVILSVSFEFDFFPWCALQVFTISCHFAVMFLFSGFVTHQDKHVDFISCGSFIDWNLLYKKNKHVSLSCFPSVCSPRLVVHHDLAFPVEGVRHHAGQLSSSLHNQIPEAQVFTSELLQAVLVSQTWITLFCSFVLHWALRFQHFFYSLNLSDGQDDLWRKSNTLEKWEVRRNEKLSSSDYITGILGWLEKRST